MKVTQLTHDTTPFSEKKLPIIVLCDRVYFQDNIGSIFRISEAFGVEKIILFGENIPFTPRKINKTSRSTHNYVPFEITSDFSILKSELLKENYQIIGLEITQNSIPLPTLEIAKNKKIVLIIGNEIDGISESFLSLCENFTHIDMYGKNSSMNVVQALGIALYAITTKLTL